MKPKMFVKRTQVKPSTRDYGTQTVVLKRTIGTQYEEQIIDEETTTKMEVDEEEDDHADIEEDHSSDEDYIPSDEYEVSEEEPDTETRVQEILHADVPYKERQFLVTESCLLELLNKCKQCGENACVTLKSFVGTMIVVEVLCTNGHDYVWRSQVLNNAMPWGNLLLSSAILFSGSSPAKVINLFSHLNVPVFTTRTYSNLQYAYLVPSVLRTWDIHQADMLSDLQGETLSLGGDARCDSPGHSAKFGSYTLMNLQDNKILHVELIQSNEVKNSYNMELEGLKRGLEYLNDCGMAVTEFVTDRHVQVRKFMSDKQPETQHFFDVWHMAKGVSKKLEQAAKKKECGLIRPWIKSVVNHMYWIAASCGTNSALKKAKWISIVNHICDKHEGHDDLFPKCEHGPIVETKKWIKTGSRAYKALLAVVKSPYLLRDIGKMSPVHQTYGLEVYHNIVNHFATKSTHFFYESMLARVHLAALHFNENSGKPQATTKTGSLRYTVAYPKAKKGDEAVVKPQREGPTYKYVKELLEIVTSRRISHPNYQAAKADAERVIGQVPDYVSTSFKKFDKRELIKKHKSRYTKTKP